MPLPKDPQKRIDYINKLKNTKNSGWFSKGHKPLNTGRTYFKKRNGFFNDNGYIKLYLPEHPLANKKGLVREHHKVLYDNGIELEKGQVVHHRNENRADNRLENLEVMTNSDHLRLHRLKNILKI